MVIRGTRKLARKNLGAKKKKDTRKLATTSFSAKQSAFRTERKHPFSFGAVMRTLQPNKMKVTLRFSFNDGLTHLIDSTAGSVTDWVYKANSMYDPYNGAGGDNPRGFDQWMAMYRYYTVIASKIFVEFFYADVNAAAGTNLPFKVGVLLSDASGALTTTNQVAEYPRSDLRTITGSFMPTICTKKYSTKKFWARSGILSDDALQGTVNNSPSEIAYYHIVGYALNAATANVYYTGWIDYVAVLTSPIMPSQSTN